MAKVIRLELEPVYKTNFAIVEMEPESWSTNVGNSYDENENDDYWKNWNRQQKWMPQD